MSHRCLLSSGAVDHTPAFGDRRRADPHRFRLQLLEDPRLPDGTRYSTHLEAARRPAFVADASQTRHVEQRLDKRRGRPEPIRFCVFVSKRRRSCFVLVTHSNDRTCCAGSRLHVPVGSRSLRTCCRSNRGLSLFLLPEPARAWNAHDERRSCFRVYHDDVLSLLEGDGGEFEALMEV